MTSLRQTTLLTEDIHPQINFRAPTIADGAGMWRVARDSTRLDLNSPYAYLMWARDHAGTSVLAESAGELAGFVTGYLRPESPETVMVWQIAVEERFRGHGVAARLLDELITRSRATALEATITEDNPASTALFASLARHHGADHRVTELFSTSHFPVETPTAAEFLHRIAPVSPAAR